MSVSKGLGFCAILERTSLGRKKAALRALYGCTPAALHYSAMAAQRCRVSAQGRRYLRDLRSKGSL